MIDPKIKDADAQKANTQPMSSEKKAVDPIQTTPKEPVEKTMEKKE